MKQDEGASAPNRYCEVLKIQVPRLDSVVGHPEANAYSLLIAALLERGAPMTLPEVAERLEAAGAGNSVALLTAMKRCRPARSPVYRDGDRYGLDPHDDELDLWAFRLGLRPPKVPSLEVVRAAPPPIPGPDQPLTVAELDEAWGCTWLGNWSPQRLALAVLDAHSEPMTPEEVVAFVGTRAQAHALTVKSGSHWRMGAVRVRDDGRWERAPDHEAVRSARKAVRERVAMARKLAGRRSDPAVAAAYRRAAEARRAAHAAELAKLRRVIVVCFPPKAPRTVTLLEVATRQLTTFFDDELNEARRRLTSFDVLCGLGVRELLRQLGVDPEGHRLVELGPPQKSVTLNQRGRSLKLTPAMLVQGSCGISKPFGDPSKLADYLASGQLGRLRERLEADAKSLFALYNYGRIHGWVRLRWGFLDQQFGAPWRHYDEETIYELMRRAKEANRGLEVVAGSAPGWSDPWARAKLCRVVPDGPYKLVLLDEMGFVIDERDVQLARVVGEPL